MKDFIEVHNEDFENEVELVNVAHIIRVYPDLSKRHAMIALDEDYVLAVVESPEEVRELVRKATTPTFTTYREREEEDSEESLTFSLLSYIDDNIGECEESLAKTGEKEYFYGKKFAYADIRRRLLNGK